MDRWIDAISEDQSLWVDGNGSRCLWIGACGSTVMGFDACGLMLVAEIGACGSTEFSACGAYGGEVI